MAKGIKCTCGHSWNKSDSSKKDMYVCHMCGKDNTMNDGGWLSKFDTAQSGKTFMDKVDADIAKLLGPNTDKNRSRGDIASYFPETKIAKQTYETNKTLAEADRKREKQILAKAVAAGNKNRTTVKQDNRTSKEKEIAQQQVVNAYINEAQGNSPLAQTFGSFTPTGDNPEAGKTAAVNFVDMTPIMSGVRVSRAIRDPENNPYGIGQGNGFLANTLGTLGLIGDALDVGVVMAPGAKAAGNYLTQQTSLKNPFALTESKLFNQSDAPFSMSSAPNFFNLKKINHLSKRISSGLQLYLDGIATGLGEKVLDLTSKGKEKGRSFSEMFPISESEKAKATAEGMAANLAAEEFVKDWVYDATGRINPEVKRRIDDIMFTKGSPYATGFQQNYSPYANINNPLYTTPNLMVSTRYNDLMDNPYLTDVGRSRILESRADAVGVNYANTNYFPASYTFQNKGPYNFPILEKLSTAVHEGAHTMQQLGAFEANKNLKQIGGNRGTGFGSVLAKYDKDYGYWVPNTDTEIGRQFAEVMPTPRKGKSNWRTSPKELHSELMAARERLVDTYVKGGHSYEDALKAVRTDTDKNLDLMIKEQDLNRFFKKGVSQEKKREMLRLLPAAIPVVGAVGAMDDNEEQKRNGGWLSKFEQGGMVLKQKTDNYGTKPNPNDVQASVGPDFVGLAYDTTGRNYSPAWGGQFQNGGFLQPISYKLPSRYRIPYAEPSTELATSIGGGPGEPAYLIPTFKYGKPLQDPEAEYRKTGEHLGGPFKTYQEAEKWEQEIRHPYVEKGKPIPTPLKRWGDMAMGGGIPGAVGFTYARTINPAPSNGKYAKKTKASAQNGKVLQEKRHSDLYSPIESKIDAAIKTYDEYYKLPGSTQMFIDTKVKGSSYKDNRNIPPMDPIISEVQQKIKGLSDEEVNKLLNTNWSKMGIIGAMKNAPTNVSYPEMLKYINHFNKLKKKGYTFQNGGEMKFYQEGLDFKPNSIAQDGAIVDPMGQWAHPGEVTIIPGTDITMEGVDYPVLGISDTGDTQMMYPGEDYDFDGDYVTEYPIMKNGGWLDKYK
jgi:hypothetical protein